MRLTLDELAQRLGLAPEHVRRLADAGSIARAADGGYEDEDLHRVRLLGAFEAAGVPMDALVAAYTSGDLTFDFYDELHPPPGAVSDRTYGAFAASLGKGAEHLAGLFAAFGLAEPDDATRLPEADERLLAELVDSVEATGRPDLVLRAIRIAGEGARRSADASLSAYAEALSGFDGELETVTLQAFVERRLRPWAKLARQMAPLSGWLEAHHLTRAIDDYSVQETENVLERRGYAPARQDAPPAVAFVDLSGFTHLTHQHGDEFGASLAIRLGEVASTAAHSHGGRLVKLLGDGVLLWFADVDTAVRAVLDLLDALPAAGLPTGHAGVTSGPIVARDGDVFGRTVNLAARLSDLAVDGALLVPASVAAGLDDGTLALTPAEIQAIQGVGEMELVSVTRR
jgi:adenylate cyclase